MITIEQAMNALLNKQTLYCESRDKVMTLVPKAIGFRRDLMNLKQTYITYAERSPYNDWHDDASWAVYSSSEGIVKISDLYLTSDEVVNLIVARKQKEIADLLGSEQS